MHQRCFVALRNLRFQLPSLFWDVYQAEQKVLLHVPAEADNLEVCARRLACLTACHAHLFVNLDCALSFSFDSLLAPFACSLSCLIVCSLSHCLACSCNATVQGEYHSRVGGGYARQHRVHGARSHEQWQLPTGFLLCRRSPPSRNIHHGHQHLQTRQGAECKKHRTWGAVAICCILILLVGGILVIFFYILVVHVEYSNISSRNRNLSVATRYFTFNGPNYGCGLGLLHVTVAAFEGQILW